MPVRCGQSPFRWLKNDSMCAWSVGVPGRPWCWVIAISAMNWRVSIAVISAPLSDHATRIGGSSGPWSGGSPSGPRSCLVLERLGEQQLRLGAGLLGRQSR